MNKEPIYLLLAVLLAFGLTACNKDVVILANNDLGMHCMDEDFSSFMILPPYNTVQAQVIQRGLAPVILSSGLEISYEIPGNTISSTKTNFWEYANALMGVSLTPDTGLTGNGLTGVMALPSGEESRWIVTGIPITPIMDDGTENPYPLGLFTAKKDGEAVGSTQAVVPVSWEISCAVCHGGEDDKARSEGKEVLSTALDILTKHDEEHDTDLVNSQPVMCGSCHAQAPLGTVGEEGVSSLSRAMHHSHSGRMDADVLQAAGIGVSCYACHPGVRTQCLRDLHVSKGLGCMSCHGDMSAVASENRHPWVDEPRCDDCHERDGFEFEQEGTLFRNARGHHGVACAACHGSPHAMGPSLNDADNVQAIQYQGEPGPIGRKCSVCHGINLPKFVFNHKFS
ncbi:MAG TPA: hypothetical protein PKO23_14815 [Candidatus Hydrogenedentes bacterium]|nr:hypothetical protein [Candidatus Hydrogenedentota bacterium]